MKSSSTALVGLVAITFVALAAGAPAHAMGQEKDVEIQANEMEGRRVPYNGGECGWKTGSVIIGLGEFAEFRVTSAEDKDYYLDPYPIWDPLTPAWEFYDSADQLISPRNLETWAEEHVEPGGRICYDFYARCLLPDKETYTVKCRMDDPWPAGHKADDPEIERTMTAEVEFEVRILRTFSTDGASIDEGSPKGGTVGMEIEWTAGMWPEKIAEHSCAGRSTIQRHSDPWIIMEELLPCEFPHKGKYCWNTTPADCYQGESLHCRPLACLDNGAWPHIARMEFHGDKQIWEVTDQRPVDLRNLAVQATSPPYLKYDPDSQTPENTITYMPEDAWDIYPPGQQTTVKVEIFGSDGTLVKTEEFVKAAGRTASYPYVWDGKNANKELMPKGIYTYRITGTQHTGEGEGTVLDPTHHVDTDCEKSDWEITSTSVEVVGYNEETETATMRVSFCAGPMADYPTDLELSGNMRPMLEVYDPDLVRVAEATTGEHQELPVHQEIQFPEVLVPLNKSGDYIFLVSAWESQHVDYCPEKAHRERPLLQQNARREVKKVLSLVDAGHGASDPGTLGYKPYAFNRYTSWDEREANGWVAQELAGRLAQHGGTPYCAFKRYEVEINPQRVRQTSKRAEWANGRLRNKKPKYAVFISLHCNAPSETNRLTAAYYRPDIVGSQSAATTMIGQLQSLDSEFQVDRSYSTENASPTAWQLQDMKRRFRQWLLLYLASRKRLTWKMPCNLLEMVMLTQPDDEDWIYTQAMRTAMADCIHRAYCQFTFTPIVYE